MLGEFMGQKILPSRVAGRGGGARSGDTCRWAAVPSCAGTTCFQLSVSRCPYTSSLGTNAACCGSATIPTGHFLFLYKTPKTASGSEALRRFKASPGGWMDSGVEPVRKNIASPVGHTRALWRPLTFFTTRGRVLLLQLSVPVQKNSPLLFRTIAKFASVDKLSNQHLNNKI